MERCDVNLARGGGAVSVSPSDSFYDFQSIFLHDVAMEKRSPIKI